MPKWLFGQVVFGGLGAPRPKNFIFSGNEWFVGLAAEGGKANKRLVSGTSLVVGLGAPGLPKNIWPKKHVEISFERQESLALRWIVDAAHGRKGVTMKDALAAEIIDAYNNTGGVVKKKEDTHKMAQANRAFAHLRW